jgi:hypothetical protein
MIRKFLLAALAALWVLAPVAPAFSGPLRAAAGDVGRLEIPRLQLVSVTTTGAGKSFRGSPNSATFVGASVFSSTGTSAQDLDIAGTGIQAGDLVVLEEYGTITTMTATGLGSGHAFTFATTPQTSFRWDEASTNSSTNFVKYAYKLWETSDNVSGVHKIRFASSNSFGGALVLVYRGPTSISIPNLPTYFNGGTTSLTVTGLSPSALSYGVVGLYSTRTTTAGANAPSATSWTTRASAVAFSVGQFGAMDRLTGYVGGSVATSFPSSNAPVIGVFGDLQ